MVIQGQKSRKWNFNGQHVFDYERISKEAKTFFQEINEHEQLFGKMYGKKVWNDAEKSWILCSKLPAP